SRRRSRLSQRFELWNILYRIGRGGLKDSRVRVLPRVAMGYRRPYVSQEFSRGWGGSRTGAMWNGSSAAPRGAAGHRLAVAGRRRLEKPKSATGHVSFRFEAA